MLFSSKTFLLITRGRGSNVSFLCIFSKTHIRALLFALMRIFLFAIWDFDSQIDLSKIKQEI